MTMSKASWGTFVNWLAKMEATSQEEKNETDPSQRFSCRAVGEKWGPSSKKVLKLVKDDVRKNRNGTKPKERERDIVTLCNGEGASGSRKKRHKKETIKKEKGKRNKFTRHRKKHGNSDPDLDHNKKKE